MWYFTPVHQVRSKKITSPNSYLQTGAISPLLSFSSNWIRSHLNMIMMSAGAHSSSQPPPPTHSLSPNTSDGSRNVINISVLHASTSSARYAPSISVKNSLGSPMMLLLMNRTLFLFLHLPVASQSVIYTAIFPLI